MNPAITPLLLTVGIGFIVWYLQWQMKRNQAHTDEKFSEILTSVNEVKKDLRAHQEANTDSHKEMWIELRKDGERIAKLEAVQGNCRSCGNKE